MADSDFYPYHDAKKVAAVDALMDWDTQTLERGTANYEHEAVFGPLLEKLDHPTEERREQLQKEVDDTMKGLDGILERSGGDYVTGDTLTLADFAIFFSTFYSFVFGTAKKDTYSRVSEWWDRMAKVPAIEKRLDDHRQAVKEFFEEYQNK